MGHKIASKQTLGEPLRLICEDIRFPSKLFILKQPPREIDAAGNLELSRRPSAAIVGSRHPSEHGLETTAMIARAVAKAGIPVLTAHAQGPATTAPPAPLAARGAPPLPFPLGFNHFPVTPA